MSPGWERPVRNLAILNAGQTTAEDAANMNLDVLWRFVSIVSSIFQKPVSCRAIVCGPDATVHKAAPPRAG
jgi:hypothetical protein